MPVRIEPQGGTSSGENQPLLSKPADEENNGAAAEIVNMEDIPTRLRAKLAVEFGAVLSIVSSDKVRTPLTLRVVIC